MFSCRKVDRPIIILRDKNGVLRVMSNVCRHRMSIVLEGRGNVRAITCLCVMPAQSAVHPLAARRGEER
ncbi:Rieske 2Fe-2S domain-containing protein [Rhizobium sp. L1K21]|uniref:Rieske 2Fe-2S domain-containing protein n=1 Tax=Rhizobium sp. L1K21 TaxID=2954933 RepID=UPI002092AE1B|nr:Rieske 2Fe-2S domain-containing protein [Rhizobium sp. L1K21]MCO6188631.1 Rieske 2Fe-2S domain-containing protein [Rhizobium sp. L1K21]